MMVLFWHSRAFHFDERDVLILVELVARIDHEGLFSRASSILEAKQWDADFEQRFAEQRSYRDASHQIKYYLERTPSDLK